MGLIELASLTMATAAVLGYLTDRLRLSPLPGFLLAGILLKIVLERTAAAELLGVEMETAVEIARGLLLVASIFIAFEVGRELGSAGLDVRAASIVALEATTIVALTLAAMRALGFGATEGLIVALSFLSSSTATVYKLTSRLALENAKRIALTMTTAEDVALLAALSITMGSGGNPVIVLVLTIGMAIASIPLFRALFERVPLREEYRAIAAISATLLYAAVAQRFASPHLGAFVAGYLFARSFGLRGGIAPIMEVFIMIYMLSVGFLTPLSEISIATTSALALLVALAIAVRIASIFLVSLLTLRSPFYATVLSVHMSSISELSPLVALSAYLSGMIGKELATPLVLLPLITIAVVSLISSYWEKIAFFVERRISADAIPTIIPESLYNVVTDTAITSAKISVTILAAAGSVILLERLGLEILAVLPVAAAAAYVFLVYKSVSKEILLVGRLPTIVLRTLTLATAAAIATYTAAELLEGIPEARLILPIAFIALIVFIILEAIFTYTRLEGSEDIDAGR